MWYCAFVALSSLPSNNGTQIIVFLEKEVSPQDPPLLKHNQQVAKRREHMIWDTFFVFGPIFFFLIWTTVTMILSNRNGQFFFFNQPFLCSKKATQNSQHISFYTPGMSLQTNHCSYKVLLPLFVLWILLQLYKKTDKPKHYIRAFSPVPSKKKARIGK